MSETPNEPLPIEARVRELEASRRRHFWVLLLLVFSTCGYVEGRSTDVGHSSDVQRLGNEVRRLSNDVERLSNEVANTQDELQRVAERDRNN